MLLSLTTVFSLSAMAATPGPNPTAQLPWYGGVQTQTGGAAVNIRATASLNANVIGTLNGGRRLHIIERSGNWFRVYFNGGNGGTANQGWISADFVRHPPNTTQRVFQVTAASGANYRSSPSLNGASLAAIPHGTRIPGSIGHASGTSDWRVVQFRALAQGFMRDDVIRFA